MEKFDYIFCGFGASASLLLLSLYDKGLLSNKKILLLDKEFDNTDYKTFCFWSQHSDNITQSLNPLITFSWNKVKVGDSKADYITPFSYNHIKSNDLKSKALHLLPSINHIKISAEIDSIERNDNGSFVKVNGKSYRSDYIFDSRTPRFLEPKKNEAHIYQSFYGWVIDLVDSKIDPTEFKFMDFNIEQNEHTQFVYVLPFTENSLLVEVTRFGSEIINQETAESILEKYINSTYGNYSIVNKEKGCIPMTNTQIIDNNELAVIKLGAANYNLKSSTGYCFKNSFDHADAISDRILNEKNISKLNKSFGDQFQGRFAFYDGLLLDILKNNPKEGKPIFETLFKKVSVPTVLKFLDEKTSIVEEIGIFYKLPWKPFLKSLISRIDYQILLRPMLLLFTTLCLLILGNFSSIQSIVGYGILGVGMFLVGFPHGAVDHLILNDKWNFKNLYSYIFRYLSVSLFMGLVWFLAPEIALMVFLLYSAWHFGQADGKTWGLGVTYSFLWGISLLVFILGTHTAEANNIINPMAGLSIPFEVSRFLLLPWIILAIYKKSISFLITVIWLVIASTLPLLFTFGLYFVGQHSINGWNEIKAHLKINDRSIWIKALPFHFGAWILLGFFCFLSINSDSFESINYLSLFFIFISCISLPHSLVMNKLYLFKFR